MRGTQHLPPVGVYVVQAGQRHPDGAGGLWQVGARPGGPEPSGDGVIAVRDRLGQPEQCVARVLLHS